MYSYIRNIGNNVFCKKYDEDGKYTLIKDTKFKPSLYIKDQGVSKFKGFITDENLKKVKFNNIYDYKDYIKEIGENRVYGHLGSQAIVNQYIQRKKLSLNKNFALLSHYFIDIEVLSFKEFPDAINVKYPITAICVVRSTDRETRLWGLRTDSMHKYKKQRQIFRKFKMFLNRYPEMSEFKKFKETKLHIKEKIKEFKKDKEKTKYYKDMLDYLAYTKNIIYEEFVDERELLNSFIKWVSETNIDTFVGYNSELYDMPYIFNRIIKLFSEDKLKELSPFKTIRKTRHKDLRGNYVPSYDIVGITLIDYMNVYKKYTRGEKPSWKLKDVAKLELGHTKIEHEESFWDFYHNRPQIYFEYNIVDTDLLYLMDKKLSYISTAFGMVHLCSLPFKQFEHNTILWDGYLSVYLKNLNLIIPPIIHVEPRSIEGAYNKQPIPNIYDWVTSFDLNSLYPHLIMQYNISPETYIPLEKIKDKKLIQYAEMAREKVDHIEPFPHSNGVDLTLENKIDYAYIASHNLIMTPSGSFFRSDIRGIAPIIMESIYKDRKVFQKKANELYNLMQNETDKQKIKKMKIEADILNNEQYVLKIFLNSFYGAFLEKNFRYYNSFIGESITSAGQLSIRFIINWINDFLNEECDIKDHDFVVGSSTDSMYLCLSPVVDKKYKNMTHEETINWLFDYADNVITKELSRGYSVLADRCHAFENKMHMGREVIADRSFWQNKRYYALRIYSDEKIKYYKEPKIKIVGFPIVKSSIPDCVKPKMKDMIKMILDRKSGRELYSILKAFKKEFNTYDYRDIAISSNVNYIDKNINDKKRQRSNWKKDLRNYNQGKDGGTHENAKGAIVYNNLIDKYDLGEDKKIIEGSKAKFIFLKEPNSVGIKYIAFDEKLYEEFNLIKYVDYNAQFNRIFAKIMLDCMKELGLNWKSTWKTKRR
jgi:DNA polymerase elongation subunit (family B)